MPSEHPPHIDRRDFLGGLSLTAAAAFSLTVPAQVAARVTDGQDDPVQTISSPDGSIEVTVDVGDGSLTYSVTHDGTTVVGDSALGFAFQNQPAFGDGLAVTGSERATTDQTWTPVWDQYDEIRNHHEELRIGLEESSDPGRSLTLAVRAFDDGAAFRYVFPEDSGFGDFVITGERTQFAFEGDHTSWWIQNDYNSYEYSYRETPLSELGSGTSYEGAHTPLTMRTENDRYVSVHEADLLDYAAMGLEPTETATTLESDLAPLPDGTKVTASAPHRTPWRTIQIADRPGALIESNLIVNCNEPLDPEHFPQGTDWIEPAKFIGIWWLMITGRASWQYRGPTQGNHAAQTERMKQYMDFASEHGIRSVLVEGWNQGWDSYPGSGDTMDFDQSYEDFDLEGVTDYGQSLDPPVEMTAHNETSGNISRYESQLAEDPNHFADYDDLGIHSIKTGYVADNGVRIDGEIHSHHCQPLVNHHHLVYREAAKNRQMLEVHEPVKPTGERRRFPNVMTKEGVLGQEYDSFGTNSPSHHVTFPFTRMLAGPVEYTPGIFDMDSGSGGIETTRAKQLAMYPTYLSGLHMVADLPSSYLADQPATLSVGGVGQAEFTELGPFSAEAAWGHAQGERYVPVDRSSGSTGSRLTWTVEDVPEAGEYDVHVRYANGTGSEGTLSVVAGDSETQVTFPKTDHWDVWNSVSTTMALDAGDNTVGLKLAAGDSGRINVDAIAISQPGESMPEPETAPIRGPTVEEFQFVEDVPAAGWDDTRVLDSVIGEYTVTARRKDEEWFVGVMTGDDARVLDVPLEFLDDAQYVAELYGDGPDAAFDTNLDDVSVEAALVDRQTTLLASLVGSGGMAVRLRPADADDQETLSSYERPTQNVSASIDSETLTSQPFATVTVANEGTHVGGTEIELLVDGEVVEALNARAGPDESRTISLGHRFTEGGTYEVEIRTGETTIATESVTAIRPQSVAAFLDGFGDDGGPGEFTYPSGSAYRSGAFDLQSFVVTSTPDRARFAFEVATLYDAREASRGFSPHMFVLWVHDPSADGGRTSARDDLGANVDFQRSWHYRVAVSGSTASVIRADGSTLVETAEIDTLVDIEGNTVTVAVPRSAFDGEVSTFSVAAGVHAGADGTLMAVAAEASESAFGGADPVENAPRLSDIVTPSDVEQSEALSYGSDDRASLPFVPLGEGADDGGETTPSGSGDGPGFGVVSGALGTAGGLAYGIRSLTNQDGGPEDRSDH